MNIKPKEALLNLPIVLMFDDSYGSALFAANINTLIHGKVRLKYEDLGQIGAQVAAIFYFQRNDEYHSLREQFVNMIEQEEMAPQPKYNGGIECDVTDGHCACGAFHDPA